MKIKFRNFLTDKRTSQMVLYAEKIYGAKLTITQGGYNHGGVAASAGTHDGPGVLDFSVRGLTLSQINKIVRALRLVGFAAWHRKYRPGVWGAHIHAVAVKCKGLPAIAARQVASLRRGRDGLAGDGRDPHHGMNLPVVTFEHYLASIGKIVAKVSLKSLIATVAKTGKYPGVVGAALKKETGGDTILAYGKWQRELKFSGRDADGLAGMESLSKLGAKYGFKVVA